MVNAAHLELRIKHSIGTSGGGELNRAAWMPDGGDGGLVERVDFGVGIAWLAVSAGDEGAEGRGGFEEGSGLDEGLTHSVDVESVVQES